MSKLDCVCHRNFATLESNSLDLVWVHRWLNQRMGGLKSCGVIYDWTDRVRISVSCRPGLPCLSASRTVQGVLPTWESWDGNQPLAEISHCLRGKYTDRINTPTTSTHPIHQYINTSIHSNTFNTSDTSNHLQSTDLTELTGCRAAPCSDPRGAAPSCELRKRVRVWRGPVRSILLLMTAERKTVRPFLSFLFFSIFFHIFNFSYFSLNLPFLAKWALNSALRTAEPGQIFIFAWRCSAKALDTSSRRATRATLFVAHWHITLCHAETGNWAQRLYMIW